MYGDQSVWLLKSLQQSQMQFQPLAGSDAQDSMENPMDRGAWWATVHGVAKSRTQLRTDTFPFKVPILGSWNIPDSLTAKWVLIINTAWSSPVHWAGMTKTILWHKIRLTEAGPMTSLFSIWKQGDNKLLIYAVSLLILQDPQQWWLVNSKPSIFAS